MKINLLQRLYHPFCPPCLQFELSDTSVLAWFRQYANIRSSSIGQYPEEDKATYLTNLPDRTIVEGHHKVGKVCPNQRRGLWSELFTCRGIGEAVLVHQLNIGTTWLQYPLEDVPSRNDRTSRTLSQPEYDESQSNNGIE